jgi:hypothetical protein
MSVTLLRTLRIAAVTEAASPADLSADPSTAHTQAVTTLVGPPHGTAYLVTIAAAWMLPPATSPGARWYAAVPGVGGLLALGRTRNRPREARHPARHAPEG